MKQYIGDIVVQGIIWDTWVYWMFARIGISDLFISSTNSAFHRTTVERDNELFICTQGNAGMGTGGMGDVLAGMIASLKAQFHEQVALHEIVSLHAQAGDLLAENGMRGLQAHEMGKMIYKVVNKE